MNPERIAKIVNAITHRSLLLSTKTKNAHIQLVSRNNSIIHPLYIPSVVVISSSSFSSFFGEKYVNTSLMSPVQKIRTNTQLRKFIATAIVSGASQNRLLIGCMSANRNVTKICRRYGAAAAGPTLPRSTPWLCASTLGIYIYS